MPKKLTFRILLAVRLAELRRGALFKAALQVRCVFLVAKIGCGQQ